jgi:hypothetical protein
MTNDFFWQKIIKRLHQRAPHPPHRTIVKSRFKFGQDHQILLVPSGSITAIQNYLNPKAATHFTIIVLCLPTMLVVLLSLLPP